MCTGCHDDTDAASPNGTPTIRGVESSVAPATVTDHITYTGGTTAACTQCHNPHNPPAGGPDCFTCHTAGGAAGSTYDYIDALFKDVGLDADNTANKPASDPSNGYEWSQHGGFDGTGNARFRYQSPYDKPNNDCQKCHGERHKNANRLINPDTGDTLGEAFTPVDSLQATTVTNANNFCLTCHDGDGAAADIRIGGVDPPEVNRTNWTGIGHGKESGSYASGNDRANLKCIACHEVHGSNHAKLLAADNTTTPPGDRVLGLEMPLQFAEKTVGSTQARDLDFRDYTDPAVAGAGFDNNWKSSKGFGTAGDPGNQYEPVRGRSDDGAVRRLPPGRPEREPDAGQGAHAHGDCGTGGPGVPDVVRPGLRGMPQPARGGDRQHLHDRGQRRVPSGHGERGGPKRQFHGPFRLELLRRHYRCRGKQRGGPVHGVPRDE
jgi:hypothetical protein